MVSLQFAPDETPAKSSDERGSYRDTIDSWSFLCEISKHDMDSD